MKVKPMKLKDRLIKEIEDLPPEDITDVYEMVLDLKKKKSQHTMGEIKSAYLKVQETLKKCKGALSDDISRLRWDRI